MSVVDWSEVGFLLIFVLVAVGGIIKVLFLDEKK